jgi:hypothetical protein
VLAQGSRAACTTTPAAFHAKPYRVLLVVDQWSDPSGLVVHSEKDKFQPVAALLKAWSVPFDILRLDQQHLDATYLFRRSGNIRYGAVIWLADSSSYGDQDIASLDQATRDGTGLIVVYSRFLDPTLDKLLGLKFKQFYGSTDAFHVAQEHFITRDISSGKNAPPQPGTSNRLWVEPTSAEVLIAQGQHPVLTVNQLGPEVSAVWLGSPHLSELCDSVFWRNLLFRSLVFSLGYVVVPNEDYAHRIIFELDDWGTADKGFLPYWHYLEPSEETIRQYLILPLKQHHAIASAMADTGYVDRKSKRILSPWTQKFTDSYGLNQDFASTRAGLKDGIAEGVLEIESHGWTHMQPDLESPPGPWWTADMAGEGSVDGWYVEFRDRRRDKEIPAVTQMYHMERSLAEVQQDFGVQALELKPGGDGWSKSQFNNTAALAARVGFGIYHGDIFTYYLDHELVLDMANVVPDFDALAHGVHPEQWPDHPDGPLILGFHDMDIALTHNFMDQLFASLPAGYHTMGTNQYVGILHTQIDSSTDGGAWQLTFTQDNHYCAYFASHPSSWQLWLSDPLREQLAASHLELSIDAKSTKISAADFHRGTLAIDLPPGVGSHTWKLETAKNNKQP